MSGSQANRNRQWSVSLSSGVFYFDTEAEAMEEAEHWAKRYQDEADVLSPPRWSDELQEDNVREVVAIFNGSR